MSNLLVARHGNHGHEHTHDIFIKIHGVVLTAAFSVAIPFGIACIRSGSSRSFGLHWMVQLTTMILSLGAMLVMLVRSWTYIVAGTAGTHHYIGLSIFAALLVQSFMGWRHHVLYKQTGRRSRFVSPAHVGMGWIVLCLGWVNTILGFRMAGISSILTIIWLLWLMLMSFVMLHAPYVASKITSVFTLRGQRQRRVRWRIPESSPDEEINDKFCVEEDLEEP